MGVEVVTYTTGERPEAPPHPIITIAKVNVEMTKLTVVNTAHGSSMLLVFTLENQVEWHWQSVYYNLLHAAFSE